MNEHMLKRIQSGAPGSIYATVLKEEKVCLVRVGSYDEVRGRYNQMACLIGAISMRALQEKHPKALHSTAALPGTWVDRFGEGRPISSPAELFDAAGQPPSSFGDSVGFLAYHADWPHNAERLLSGMQNACKAMSNLADVFYQPTFRSSVTVGGSMEVSAVRRVQEALKVAKKEGRPVFEEEKLLEFMDLVVNAKFLHLFHEVASSH